MKQLYLCLLFAFVASFCKGQAGSISFENTSWENVLQRAKKENKPIFLYAYTPACGFCKQMEKEVFTNSEAAASYNSTFLNYKIDIEDGAEGEALAAKYAIVAYPSYLYFDREGTLLHQSGSYKSAAEIILEGKNAFNPHTALFALKRKYDKGNRSARLLYDYSQALADFHHVDNPKDIVVDQYLNTQSAKRLASEKNLKFIFTMDLGINASATQYFLLNQQKFLPYFQEDEVAQKARRIIRRAALMAGSENDTVRKKNIQGLITSAMHDTSRLASLARIYFFSGQKKWLRSAEETLVYASGESKPDWMILNETATYLNYFSKDKEVLQKGAEIMAKAVEIERSYENLHLFAVLLTKADNKAAAIEAATAAITVAAQTGEDSSEATKLILKLNKSK